MAARGARRSICHAAGSAPFHAPDAPCARPAILRGKRFCVVASRLSSCAYFSAITFRLARPVSNSRPIILSTLQNESHHLPEKAIGTIDGPSNVRRDVRGVALGFHRDLGGGWASNGLRKSTLKTTLDGEASVTSIRPCPMFLLPSHSYTAPLPLAAPL